MIRKALSALLRFEFTYRGGRDVSAILKTFELAIERLRTLAGEHKSEAADMHAEADKIRGNAYSLENEAARAVTVAANLSKLIGK